MVHRRTRINRGAGLSWLEVCALTFGATPAADLPALISRVLHPGRLQYLQDSQWGITLPLLQRLKSDSDAVDALRISLSGNSIPVTTPFFADTARSSDRADTAAHTAGRHAEISQSDRLMRRVFAATIALSYAGHLRPDDLETALDMLKSRDTRSIVLDPYLDESGPLWAAGMSLLRPPGH
jgi:hypothetical protein